MRGVPQFRSMCVEGNQSCYWHFWRFAELRILSGVKHTAGPLRRVTNRAIDIFGGSQSSESYLVVKHTAGPLRRHLTHAKCSHKCAEETINIEAEPWPNNMGLKNEVLLGCLKEHIWNLRTFWEPDNNILGTWWNTVQKHLEHRKNKKLHPLHHPKLKISAALSLLIGCMKFLFSKQFVIIFTLD